MVSLNKAIVKSVVGRLCTYLIQFISLAIYARLFSPAEFGVIASVQVFVIFFQLLADVGIGPAIINEDEFGGRQRDGIFTFTAITGSVFSFVFFCFSYVLNSFYGGYEYQQIAVFVCIAIFFNSLNTVPVSAMYKDARFISVAVIDIAAESLSLIVVSLLYSKGYGLLALAARPACQSGVKFVATWFFSKNTELGRPAFGSELHHIKSILSFSLYQFGFNFINYFSRNLDNILIARYFGMYSVGLYDKAYQLMRYPLMITTFAMTPAIQPVLTKLRSDKRSIISEHNKLTCRLLIISVPISAFIYFNSANIILILFGDQWSAIEPLIKIFSFMIPVQAVLSTSGSFFQVMNEPRLLFISGVVSAVVNVTAIVTGIVLGEMRFVAFSLLVGFSLNYLQAYFILFKYCFRENSGEFWLYQFKALTLMSAPVLLYYVLMSVLMFGVGDYLSLPIDFLLSILIGLGSIFAFFIPINKLFKFEDL